MGKQVTLFKCDMFLYIMINEIPTLIFNNWGNLVSVAGLIVTIYVLIVSKRAEDAAVETRNIIERKSVAQELRECGDDINLIKINSEYGVWHVALYICNKLIIRLTFTINRWADHFSDDTKSNLSLIITQLDTLNTQLRKFTNRIPNNSELSGILSVLVRVSTILAAEYGKYESTIDKK